MTALYEAAKQALAFTMRDFSTVRDFEAAKAVLQDTIRSALVEEEKAVAWLAERKEHWRKEKEKIQATDPELSAALGWPGGISDPVLDRKTLLQMVAAMRLASQQALEALKFSTPNPRSIDDDYAEQGWKEHIAAITALRAALVQQVEPAQELVAKMTAGRAVYFMERFKREEKLLGPNEQAALDFVISMLEQQAEPARERVSMDEYKRLQGLVTSQGIRLMEYESKQPQQAEPVEPVAWRSENANPPGGYVIFQQYPQALADLGKPIQPLYTAPPQRKLVPLTEEEIFKIENDIPDDVISDRAWTICLTRAVEKAVWEKNHGQA